MGKAKTKGLGIGASRLALGVAALSVAGAASATTTEADTREFSYFLPRTAIQVEIKQQLNSCDFADGKEVDIATTITVTPLREADPEGLVRLDAGANFLAKRTVKLELNPDGTLAAFNSQSEGQAGPVLGAVSKFGFKIAAAAATGGAGGLLGGLAMIEKSKPKPPAPPKETPCNAKTEKAFKAIETLSQAIGEIENNIKAGKGDAAQTALLGDLRLRRAKAKEQMTLTRTLPIPFAPGNTGEEKTVSGPSLVSWLKTPRQDSFTLRVESLVEPGSKLFSGDGTKFKDDKKESLLLKKVVYRKGVPGVILLAKAADMTQCVANSPASLEHRIDCVARSDKGVVTRAVFPQFSEEYAIRAGKGGLFGSRQAGIKFDANGVPMSLEYGSTSASTDLATLAGTATDGVQTLRDAPLSNLERAIKLEEAKAKLKKLQADAAAAEDSE